MKRNQRITNQVEKAAGLQRIGIAFNESEKLHQRFQVALKQAAEDILEASKKFEPIPIEFTGYAMDEAGELTEQQYQVLVNRSNDVKRESAYFHPSDTARDITPATQPCDLCKKPLDLASRPYRPHAMRDEVLCPGCAQEFEDWKKSRGMGFNAQA